MPRTDVFNRRTDVFGGTFTADSVKLTFPNVVGLQAGLYGLLVQNLDMTYRQQITRLYELGTPAIYYIAGRTAGNGTLSRVMGPQQIGKAFYTKYGDVCQAASNTFALEAGGAGCGEGDAIRNITGATENIRAGSVRYQAYFVVLDALRINLTAEQVMIGENLSFMFSSLDYELINSAGGVTP